MQRCAIALGSLALAASGCVKYSDSLSETPPLLKELADFKVPVAEKMDSVVLDQTLPMAEAMRRASHLKSGMTKREVLLLLGKPAIIYHTGWHYLPQDETGATDLPTTTPNESVDVTFEGGKLKAWSVATVTYGVGGGDGGSYD